MVKILQNFIQYAENVSCTGIFSPVPGSVCEVCLMSGMLDAVCDSRENHSHFSICVIAGSFAWLKRRLLLTFKALSSRMNLIYVQCWSSNILRSHYPPSLLSIICLGARFVRIWNPNIAAWIRRILDLISFFSTAQQINWRLCLEGETAGYWACATRNWW